jgi:hypothetical protein
MRVMVIVKASRESEAGVMPTTEMLDAMGKFNEELANAGVMLAGEGLHPSSKGVRVRFTGKDAALMRGPFDNASELVAGYWLWQVDSLDEAIDWIRRSPLQDAEVELRPLFETEDFGDEFTPELRAQEERVRAQAEQTTKGIHH